MDVLPGSVVGNGAGWTVWPCVYVTASIPQIEHTEENLCRGYENLEYLIHKYPP
jgi:hypothetical protein